MADIALLKRQLSKNINVEEAVAEVVERQLKAFYTYHFTSLSLNFVMFKESAAQQVKIHEVKYFIDAVSEVASKVFGEGFGNKDAKAFQQNRKRISGLKGELKHAIKVLTAYSDYLKMVEYKKNRFESYQELLPSDEEMTREVLAYVYQINQHAVIKDRMQMIFAQLPARLTTVKVQSMIDETIEQYKGASKRALTDFTHMMMETIQPQTVEGFGEAFKDVYDECVKLNTAVSLKEDLGRCALVLNQLSVVLSDLMNFHLVVAEVLDNILGIVIASYPIEAPFESEAGVEATFMEITRATDEERINTLLTSLEGILESTMDEINECQPLVSDVLEAHRAVLEAQFDTSLIKDFELLEQMMSNSYFPDVQANDDQQASYSDLAQSKKLLGDFVGEVFKGADRADKMALTGNLWPMLMIPFKSGQEVSDYIFDTLAQSKTGSEKAAFWELFKQIRESDINN